MPPRSRRVLITLLGLIAVIAAVLASLPVVSFQRPYSTVVYGADGQLLSASVASDGQWRFPASDGPLPKKYVAALLRFEDQRFYAHPGIDIVSVLRALYLNATAGRVVSGASTLTMQTVRLAGTNTARTLSVKLGESLLALRLDWARDKDRILAMYAAHAPFGGNTVGLEAATQRYFGRPPTDLTWAEAATLAVLPNSPALIHPGRNRDALKRKRDRLLSLLRTDGLMDAGTYELSIAEPLPSGPRRLPQLSLHLMARAGRKNRPSLHTPVDRALQESTLRIARRWQSVHADNGIHNLAVVVARVADNHVLAYHGNVWGDGAHEDYVDVARAPRSTGSLLKPFLYEQLQRLGLLLPEQIVPDIPISIGGFAPENFDRKYRGAVPANLALAQSLNIPATIMLQDVGVAVFRGYLRGLGLSTIDRSAADYGLSLILGGAEAPLTDLVGAYAALARSALGDPRPGRPLIIETSAGNGAHPGYATGQKPASSYLTLQALLGVSRPGVNAAWREFASGRKIAWKTGTSFGLRDGWAIGVDTEHVVGVWVGNADGEGRPGLTGFGAAAPVLFEIFGALPSAPWFEAPEDLAPVVVCAESGMRAGPSCARTHQTLSAPAGIAGPLCGYCQDVHLDPDLPLRAHSGCQPVHTLRTEARFVLPPRIAHYYRRERAHYAGLPPWREDCAALSGEPRMGILSPKRGAQVYVPTLLGGRLGKVVFAAAHRREGAQIHWHLDAQYVGSTQTFHQMELAPAPGTHVLTVVDDSGATVEHRFSVLSRKSG